LAPRCFSIRERTNQDPFHYPTSKEKGSQMQLIRLLIIIACVAGVVWAINKYTDIDPKFKQLILAVGLIGSIVWALHDFGVF